MKHVYKYRCHLSSCHIGLSLSNVYVAAIVISKINKASLPVEDLKNYHPVSGLSFISKLVEPVVAKQLVDHIHGHALDISYQ